MRSRHGVNWQGMLAGKGIASNLADWMMPLEFIAELCSGQEAEIIYSIVCILSMFSHGYTCLSLVAVLLDMETRT